MVSYPSFCKRKDRRLKFTRPPVLLVVTVKTSNCYFHRPSSDSTTKSLYPFDES